MRLSLIALALVIAILAAGCLQQPAPVTPTSTPAAGRYVPGDLLQGDLVGAGFDTPNGTPAGSAILILEYRSAPDQYVYTLVQPVPGGWAYVFPSDNFVTRLSRDRTAFESYRLDRIGHVDLSTIRGPPNATPLRSS